MKLLFITLLLAIMLNGQTYLKEDFETWGWWNQWVIQIDSSATKNLTWGPSRSRFYRESTTDTRLFSAFASRKLIGSDNYDSTFTPTVHSFMTRSFTYEKTTYPVYLEFRYLINILKTLIKTDTFYVTLKKHDSDKWIRVFLYSNTVKPPYLDGISGTNTWFPASVQLSGILDTLLDGKESDTLQIRFGFIGNTNPENIYELYNRATGVWIDNIEIIGIKPIKVYAEWDNPFVIDNCQLFQNFPNPFNNSTTIKINAKNNCVTDISIYSSNGKMIYNKKTMLYLGVNYIDIEFNQHLPSGVYMYVLSIERNYVLSKKMIYLK